MNTSEHFEITGSNNDFPLFCWRTISVYMVAYMIAGIIAQIYYQPIWDSGALSLIMKPMNSSIVALGPALQSINAFIISIILYQFRYKLIDHKYGWAYLLLLIAGFSIFVPQAPAPSSFEGFIYTKLSITEHLIGLPETIIFSCLFSFGLFFWYKKPKKIWTIFSVIFVCLILIMSTLGYLSSIGFLKQP